VCPSTAHLPRPTAPYTPLPLGVAHALLIVTFGSFHMYPSTPHLPRPTRDSGGEEEEEGWACISTSKVTYPCEYRHSARFEEEEEYSSKAQYIFFHFFRPK